MEPLTPQQRILLVEDSPEDVVAAKRNLLHSGLRNPLQICETGQLALDYIFQRGGFSDPHLAPTPGVILLDLNLPDMSGLEILTILKQDPAYRSIPVIIMTSSVDERDFEEGRQAGADAYFPKPVDFQKFWQAIQDLQGFSFELMIYPTSKPYTS